MRREDYKTFIVNKRNCMKVDKAFLQFSELAIHRLTVLVRVILKFCIKIG